MVVMAEVVAITAVVAKAVVAVVVVKEEVAVDDETQSVLAGLWGQK